MADWDADSDRLTCNITRLVESSVWKDANQRNFPDVRQWHRQMMAGLNVPDPAWVGAYRGAAGLETINVHVGGQPGTPAEQVEGAVAHFEDILQQAMADLDEELPRSLIDRPDFVHTDVQLYKVIELCAWVHAEWVRIHPFANGNGRTARIWANYVAVRYGLPAFVRIRPRPDPLPYGEVGRLAMQGDWQPTVVLFQRMLRDYLDGVL